MRKAEPRWLKLGWRWRAWRMSTCCQQRWPWRRDRRWAASSIQERAAPAPLAVCPDHPAEVLEVLAGALMGFRAMRSLQKALCRRRAQHFVTSSERATIINALKTWAELRSHMEGWSRPLPPQHVDVDSFFQCGTARAVASLRWLVKQAKLPLDLSAVQLLARPSKPGKAGQAAVAEPPMLPMDRG